MSSGSKSSRDEAGKAGDSTVGSSVASNSSSHNPRTDNDNTNNHKQVTSEDISDDKLAISNDLSWLSKNKDTNCKVPNTLDSQQQRLNLLVELISSQEAQLNRLKALRKLAKEQAAINVELNNELKTVNNSISEKDGELRQALNRVDNLNRQLNSNRRTRPHRSNKSISPVKQEDDGSAKGGCHIQDNSNRTQDVSASSLPLTSGSDTHSKSIDGNVSAKNSSPIPDTPDLINTKSVNSSDKDEREKLNITSALITESRQAVAHSHVSPALTKYTNARQKLIGTGFKDKSTGRRVSFDPLALLLDAALEGELDLVIQTSKQVPDLSASHDECVTALHNAVVAGHYEVAKFLIEAGCDINTQDSDGWTPLHCAASCNNLSLVKLLVENGALIYASTTSDHSTPAMKCEQTEEGFEECYKYLTYLQNNLGVMNNGLVYALYDYEAQEPDELSFKTDDELLILRRDDSQEQEWWWAQKQIKETSDSVVDIKEGYIPRNLVGLHPRVKAFKRNRISEATANKNSNGFSE